MLRALLLLLGLGASSCLTVPPAIRNQFLPQPPPHNHFATGTPPATQ